MGASNVNNTVAFVRKQGPGTACVTLSFSGEAPSIIDLKVYVGIKHALVSTESCGALPLTSCRCLCCLAR